MNVQVHEYVCMCVCVYHGVYVYTCLGVCVFMCACVCVCTNPVSIPVPSRSPLPFSFLLSCPWSLNILAHPSDLFIAHPPTCASAIGYRVTDEATSWNDKWMKNSALLLLL